MCELGQTAAGEQETYPYLCKKGVDGTKDGLGWCDRGDFLCKIRGLDCCIQRLGGTLPPLGSLGLSFHGRDSRLRREGCEEDEDC